MIDSRYAATVHYVEKKWPLTKKVTLLLAIPCVAGLITWLVEDYISSTPALNALFLLITAAGWWISESIPPFAVSLFIIGFSIYFLENSSPEILTTNWEKYTNTWSNPVIWVLLGGFFLSIGARLTELDKVFTEKVLFKFCDSPAKLLLAVMLLTAVFSMFMSNTATTEMMFIIAAPFFMGIEANDPFKKSLALGIPAAATLGGMGTIIGSAPNAIAAGTIQAGSGSFNFVDWMVIGIPLTLVFTTLIWMLLLKKYKTQIKTIDVQLIKSQQKTIKTEVSRESRLIVLITFLVTLTLWSTEPMHHIPVAAVSFIPIVALSVTGIVTTNDVKKLPWDTFLLIAGGLTLGVAIHDSGLANSLSELIPKTNNTFLLLLILAYLTSLLSNLMSNTAAASVLIPIGLTLLPNHLTLVALTIGFSASTAFMLPISTPPNAIAFSKGYIQQKDLHFTGLVLLVLAPLIITSIIYLVF